MTSILDVIQKIEKVAPVLAAALVKMNPVADALYTMVAEAFGAADRDHEDLLAKITSDPEAIRKLKTLEFEHQERMRHEENQDLESARNREIEFMKYTGRRDYLLQIIAFTVIVGFFVTWIVLIFNPNLLSKDSGILSHVTAAFMMIVHYYF